jgi:hypothetical protein
MQEHNDDLRISIHHLEKFAAKVVSDPSLEAAREYLEDLQGAIACVKERPSCPSTRNGETLKTPRLCPAITFPGLQNALSVSENG